MVPKNLSELLTASAKEYGKRTALIFGQKKISYQTLAATTDSIAAGLVKLGMKEEDRIAIFLDNCPEFVISYFAILKSGAVAVPINYMFKTEETAFILRDSQPHCLITSAPI